MIPTARNVHHFALNVPDLDEAARFFVEVLGAQEVYRFGPVSDPEVDKIAATQGVNPRAEVRGVMLRFGPSTNVELMEYCVPGLLEPADPAAVGAGHFSVFVEDLAAAAAHFEGRPGCRVLEVTPPVAAGAPNAGMTNVFVLTPFGVRLELLSYPGPLPIEQQTGVSMFGPAPRWTNA